MANNQVKIIGRSAMVETQLPVHLSSAASKIPGQYVKSIEVKRAGHSGYVLSLCVAFQAMRNDDHLLRRLPEPENIKEVIVGCVDPPRYGLNIYHPAKNTGIDRFEMSIEKEKRRCVFHHIVMASC